MRALATALIVLAGPAMAELTCTLTDQACDADCTTVQVQFAIDPSQFVDPQSPDDPPRRQITFVTMDGARFAAQAIMMPGGIRGFHEEAEALGSRLMIVKPDGSARLTLQPQNTVLIGSCDG